ncbi:hypothetical protein RFI_37488, partial [Reticulomyxa filosa]
TKEEMYAYTYKDEQVMNLVNKDNDRLVGGMQHGEDQGKYPTELRALIRLCGDVMEEEELKRQLEENNGNVSAIIEKIVSTLMAQKVSLHSVQKKKLINAENKTQELENKSEQVKGDQLEQRLDILQKEDERMEIGETKPGINIQGYCMNQDCLAAKAKLPVWVNLGFNEISFHSDKTSYRCPDCSQLTVTSIVKAMFFNSEHSISASDNSIP